MGIVHRVRSAGHFAHRAVPGSGRWSASELPRVSMVGILTIFSMFLLIALAVTSSLLWSNQHARLLAEARSRVVEFDSMIVHAINDLDQAGAMLVDDCETGGRDALIRQSLLSKLISQIHLVSGEVSSVCSPISSDQPLIANHLRRALAQTSGLGQDIMLSSRQNSLLIGKPIGDGRYLIGEIAPHRALAGHEAHTDRGLRIVTRRWDGPVLNDSAGFIEPMTRISESALIRSESSWPMFGVVRAAAQSDRFPITIEILTTPMAMITTGSRYAVFALVLAGSLALVSISLINVALARRFSLERRLKMALRKRQFEPVIQPIVDAQTGRCRGGEVLMRWRHPARGLLAPGEFMGLADKLGLTSRMTMLTVARARDQLITVLKNHPELYFSFNVEASQLRDPEFHNEMERLFETDLIQPQNVVLELVEREAVDAQARVALSRLRSKGYRVAIDDFGTGQSSLALLSEIEFDILKIDRSFITAIDDTEMGRTVLEAILELARQLGVGTIAEGVETPEQHVLLVEGGVKSIQGFLISRPMPVAQFEQWLDSRKKGNHHRDTAMPVQVSKQPPAPARQSCPAELAGAFIADGGQFEPLVAGRQQEVARFTRSGFRREWVDHFASDMNAFVPI